MEVNFDENKFNIEKRNVNKYKKNLDLTKYQIRRIDKIYNEDLEYYFKL